MDLSFAVRAPGYVNSPTTTHQQTPFRSLAATPGKDTGQGSDTPQVAEPGSYADAGG